MRAADRRARDRRPARPGRRGLLVLGAVVAVVLGAVVLGPGRGSAEDRRAATAAVDRLSAAVDRDADASSADLCRTVGPRTRAGLATLARYLPEPRRACSALRDDLLRAALGPLPGATGRALEADVDGDVAVVTVGDGPEVGRAVRRDSRWIADPAVGGLGAWRLETSRRCSQALTRTRLTPPGFEAAAYARSIEVRAGGVDAVLRMLEPGSVPAGVAGVVGEPRRALEELRDGLRRAQRAVGGGDLDLDAPDSAQLPSLLQLLEAFPTLRDVGVVCLGGPAIPSASVQAGNDACLAARPQIDSAYKVAGRASDDVTSAGAFDGLAVTWTSLGQRIATIDTGDGDELRAVRDAVVAATEESAASARAIATAAREGTDAPTAAGRLGLAQQAALEGLIALGLRRCGDIGV